MPNQPTRFNPLPGTHPWLVSLLMLACLGPAAAGKGDQKAADPQADHRPARVPEHSVREMRAVKGGRAVEIEVESSEPFHFGGAVSVLKIGSSEFTRSRFPADGNPRRMIFELPAATYSRLPDAEEMTVTHGHDGQHPDRRSVGRLDRSRLKGETQ